MKKDEKLEYAKWISTSICAFLFGVLFLIFVSQKRIDHAQHPFLDVSNKKTNWIVRREISYSPSEVVLWMKFDIDAEDHDNNADPSRPRTVTLNGPHNVMLITKSNPYSKNKNCPSPRFWMRLVGEALVPILLHEEKPSLSGGEVQAWSGSFSIPIEGDYNIETRFYSCLDNGSEFEVLSEPVALVAKAGRTSNTGNNNNNSRASSSLFPSGVWMASAKFKQPSEQIDKTIHPYIWMDPTNYIVAGSSSALSASLSPNVTTTFLSTSEGIVIKEGTTQSKYGFYSFGSLSNYELVCFLGDESAEKLRRSFLDLRGKIFPNQRPFKFWHFPMYNFLHPSATWTEETAKRFRKCKHVLVSLEKISMEDDKQEHEQQPNYLSQVQYQEQVSVFSDHLTQAIDDETFPIWMFTMNEPPPLIMQASSKGTDQRTKGIKNSTNYLCHSPVLQPRTTDHPCNDALRDLFYRKRNNFPSRVRLLDNTDLSLPVAFDYESYKIKEDLFAVIGLRVYVIVGKQVEEWRKVGQQGTVNGLQRGGELEPNKELVPYTGWN